MSLRNLLSTLFFVLILLSSCAGGDSNKGDQHYNDGNYEAAIAAYNDYLATRPKDVKALYNRGRSHEELGQVDKAEQDFIAALKLDSKNTQVMLSLSNLHQKQRNHSAALLYADYAVQVPGAPAMAYFMKGRALHQLGNTKEALREYSAAIKMKSDFGQAYYYRGMLKIATKNNKEGCEDIRAALKLNYAGAQNAIDKYCN
jgi:tetratricopeptide (TPR) repeat protein